MLVLKINTGSQNEKRQGGKWGLYHSNEDKDRTAIIKRSGGIEGRATGQTDRINRAGGLYLFSTRLGPGKKGEKNDNPARPQKGVPTLEKSGRKENIQRGPCGGTKK